MEKANAEAVERRKDWLENNGFTAEGTTFVYTGETYSVKDQLKEGGAKYSGAIGWHSAQQVEGFECVVVTAEELFTTNVWGDYEYKSADELNALIDSKRPKSEEPESNYVCAIGDKVKMELTYVKSIAFERKKFGFYSGGTETAYFHRFKDEQGNLLIWCTASYIPNNKGEVVLVSGTITDHREYEGVKETYLRNCRIKAL